MARRVAHWRMRVVDASRSATKPGERRLSTNERSRLPATAANLLNQVPAWAWLVLLLIVLVLVYLPGLEGGFTFDDYPHIVGNTALHVTWHSNASQWMAAIYSSPASDLQRPLAMLSFAINHALTGLDPYWMKVTNLVIHACNTWLVYQVMRALIRAADATGAPSNARSQERQALWITAAWALNPINLMGVLYIVQRMESLNHTFVFLGLWLYLLGRERLRSDGSGWPLLLGGLFGCTIIGVLVKESAALLPLYALALEWALLRFRGAGDGYSRALAWIFTLLVALPGAIAASWMLPRFLRASAYVERDFTLGERLLTEGRVVMDYLHWTVLPNLGTLSLYHDDYVVSHGLLSPPATLVAWLVALSLLGAMVWLRRRRPLMALGLAWFFAAQLLTATVVPLELVFEHRNYFASLGVCLVLGDALLRFPRGAQRRAGAMIAVMLLAVYGGLTGLRAREWDSPLHFSLSEEAKHPLSPRATYDVARTYVILTNYRADSPYLKDARAALHRAMHVPGATTLPAAGAIILDAHLGAPSNPQWWSELRGKLRTGPIGSQQAASLESLVACDARADCQLPKQEMVDTFMTALSRQQNAEILNIYGNYALNALHEPDLALSLWQDAARDAPGIVQYQVTLAKLLIAMGRPDLAAAPIARVRHMGRLGQTTQAANELDQLAAASKRPLPSQMAPPANLPK